MFACLFCVAGVFVCLLACFQAQFYVMVSAKTVADLCASGEPLATVS